MSGDPYYHATALLLPMTGANNSTTFTDASLNPKAITRSGNTKISTTQSKWGEGSGYFDGSGDYLSTPYSATLDLVNQVFSVDGWVYPTHSANTVGRTIAGSGGGNYAYNSTNGVHWIIQIGTSNQLSLKYWSGSAAATANLGGTISANAWTHISVCKLPGMIYGGVAGAVTPVAAAMVRPSTAPSLAVGATPGDSGSSTWAFTGYMQDFRITPGIARNTADFTPPAAALPTFQDLTCNAVLLDPLLTCAPGAVAGPPVGVLLAEPIRRYDSEDGGRIHVAGQVTMGGAPVARKVRLHTLHNGRLIREAWSDPVTGAYRFDDLKDQPYYVWSEDYQRVYDPVSHLVPNLS